jgi:glycosyltransferase involved in cell wall biosynthesis
VHGEEPGNPPSRWTEGEAVLLAWVPPGRTRALRLGFGHDHPGDIETTILVNGVEVQQVVVGTTDVATSIPLRGRRDGWPVEVRVLSPTFRPADLWGSADQRELGVQVVDARLGRFPAPEPLTKLQPVHLARDFIWVDSYDRVIVNSDYCRQWTWNVWHRQPDVVSPPVLLRHPGPKRNIILSVGRFFASQRGHSKRQLDMVRAFRDLVAGGLTGWELHLVGGCEAEDRSYVDDVERLAKDLPVTLHVGAASSELDALYAAARLYWHAAGLGDDPVAHPERLEHFGIAVVEAMSAGAVPIVFGAAGPRETVRDGIDGLHFHELDGLRRQTLRVIGDPELEMRLGASSLVRAERYRREHFVERIEGILDGVVNRRGRPEAGATR